jgi:DNA topoisomerase-1
MKDALTLRTRIEANIKTLDLPVFFAHGSRILYEGWIKADPRAKSEDVFLPKLKINDLLSLKEIGSEGKQTEPPNRYSEAGLVKELEKRGIGRPSTYASIIKTLLDREYVIKEGKALIPTDTGDVVSTFLEKNFADYISDNFTADMEDKLDLIAMGKGKYLDTLKKFYTPFIKEVKSKEKLEKITNLGDADPKWKCPKCSSNMVIKLGRGGKFMSCDKFPDCDGMREIDGNEVKEAESIGIDPKSGLPIFVMDGRFGPYVQLGDGNSKSQTPNSKKTKEKVRRASIPKDKDPNSVTLQEALHYLSLPRELGVHPETGETITANIGRFGPFIVHQKDFRSLKQDDVYTIGLDRALEILREPKKVGRWGKKKK